VTDLSGIQRLTYVGMNNRAAGATAAYLMGQWLGDRPGDCRRLAPGDQHGGPVPGPPADDAGEPLQPAERPTPSEPRRYDSFCNDAATATGLVTVSKTGDSD
jgi:hypothetical protein